MPKKRWQLWDENWLYQKYWIEEQSTSQIGKLIGCSSSQVWRALKRFDVRRRTRSEAETGEKHPNWKGGKIKRVCQHCGKIFYVYPHVIKRKNRGKYCSRECSGKAKTGENGRNWEGGKVKRICEYCGKTFFCDPNEVRKGRKYCSNSCNRKGQRMPTHHTKIECIFWDISKKNNLNSEFTGDSSFWIGRINPDFIIRDKGIAIFINGDYWHSPLLRYNIQDTQRVDFQIKECKRHKWKAVIFWEADLKRKDAGQFVLLVLKKEGVI